VGALRLARFVACKMEADACGHEFFTSDDLTIRIIAIA
jgi:hypothetical protein